MGDSCVGSLCGMGVGVFDVVGSRVVGAVLSYYALWNFCITGPWFWA